MPCDWFLVPYIRVTVPGLGPYRTPALNDPARALAEEIRSMKGWWAETEIAGDQCLVKVRAPRLLLDNLATLFPPVSDPAAVWTSHFASPVGLLPSTPWEWKHRECLDDHELDDHKR